MFTHGSSTSMRLLASAVVLCLGASAQDATIDCKSRPSELVAKYYLDNFIFNPVNSILFKRMKEMVKSSSFVVGWPSPNAYSLSSSGFLYPVTQTATTIRSGKTALTDFT